MVSSSIHVIAEYNLSGSKIICRQIVVQKTIKFIIAILYGTKPHACYDRAFDWLWRPHLCGRAQYKWVSHQRVLLTISCTKLSIPIISQSDSILSTHTVKVNWVLPSYFTKDSHFFNCQTMFSLVYFSHGEVTAMEVLKAVTDIWPVKRTKAWFKKGPSCCPCSCMKGLVGWLAHWVQTLEGLAV